MARMVPDYIDQVDPKKNGERMVFKWLSDVNIEGIALHSLHQKNHKRKLIGEIDFLLITQRGFLCIEVKGGQEITRRDGQWYVKDRMNVVTKITDPFRQSKDCMYALKNHIVDTFGLGSKEASYLFGYAVVFPECIFTGNGNDLVTEVLFDCRSQLGDFPKFINMILNYWTNQEINKHLTTPGLLTLSEINRMLDLLRGDFAVVPSMNLTMQHVEQQLLEMTEEQYDALDITLTNRRVMIQGVAGTGKSLLALEKVRKMIAANKKVLYVCFNKNMALFAAGSVEFDTSKNQSFIGTYHKLLVTALPEDVNYYKMSAADLSRSFIDRGCNPDTYDLLIIDEAQDLMHMSVWESLNRFLVGGFEKGEWVMFYDPNQNIYNNNDKYHLALDYIQRGFSPSIIPLSKNCRNTEPIGRRTSIVTLMPPAKHMKISGPKVVMKTYDSKAELISKVKMDITGLILGGTSPESIVILSKYKLENSALNGTGNLCNLPIVEVSDITMFKKRALNYFTIQSFKGLESKIVFLIDVEGFASEDNRMMNYVGMSRAKILLYMYYPNSKKDEYLDITAASIKMF